jgi:integrase
MSDLVKAPSAELASLVDRAAYYGKSTIADSTKKAYEAEWLHFKHWAEERGFPTHPPDVPTVAVYLAALADGNVEVHWADRQGRQHVSKKALKYGSIQHNYQSIVHGIRLRGFEWPFAIPAITKVLHGIKYRHGDTKRRMAPLEIADLRACLAKMREQRGEDLTVIRDRAILAIGFFSAMRRSNIVALKVEDLEFSDKGMTITLQRSKTDQFAEGFVIGITPQADPAVCAVALMRRYLDVSGIKTGWCFRRIDSRSDCYGDKPLTRPWVAMIVKVACERAGLDPERYASHSLRSGFVTTAAARGVTLHNIMRQTGHKSERVAMTYIRPATVWRNNPTAGLGDEEEK